MNDLLHIYDYFARLLAYPEPDLAETAKQCRDALAAVDTSMASCIMQFREQVKNQRFEAVEELYTRTFDMGSARTLEIGWHLYGENYDRGLFLVWMRQQLKEAGIEESQGLPDHISHVLPILGRMKREQADEFSGICVLPAMNVVLDAFKDTDNPYRNLVDALCAFLTFRHGPPVETDTRVSLSVLKQHEELLAREGL